MAEIFGAVAGGVTLATLFRTCIEAFDLIQASRHQETDLKRLKLRLNIEKCRLYLWGEAMGLTRPPNVDQDRPIENIVFPELIRELLESIIELFQDSNKIRNKYGCRHGIPEDFLRVDQDRPGELAAAFSNFAIQPPHHTQAPRVVQKFTWVIHDRKKFDRLVVVIKDLIDGLHCITSTFTPVAQQEERMTRRVSDIQDAETLSQIAEVCSEDYPNVANVASTKAETISFASAHLPHVADWVEDVQAGQGDNEEDSLPDIESMTITELKRMLRKILQVHTRSEIDINQGPPQVDKAQVDVPISTFSSPAESNVPFELFTPPRYEDYPAFFVPRELSEEAGSRKGATIHSNFRPDGWETTPSPLKWVPKLRLVPATPLPPPSELKASAKIWLDNDKPAFGPKDDYKWYQFDMPLATAKNVTFAPDVSYIYEVQDDFN